MELETPWMYVKNVGTVCFSFYIPFIYITMIDIISIVLYEASVHTIYEALNNDDKENDSSDEIHS